MNPTDLDEYRDILVIAEARDGALRQATLELMAKARDLADRLGARLNAVLVAENAAELGEQLVHHGADAVRTCNAEHDGIQAQPLVAPLVKFLNEERPEIVLLSATDLGRDLGPMLAARLNTGVANDCIDLDLDVSSRLLVAKRPMYGERLVGHHVTPQARPQIATLRPGAAREGFPDDMRYGRVDELAIDLDGGPVLKDVETGGPPPLDGADTVLVGGLGLTAEGWTALESLATRLNAAIGATRAAVQAGLAPPERQVGATGETVHPRLYVGFGLSGAFEHLMGMHDAEWIVAVNEDEDANIFTRTDYALVGDAAGVVEALNGQLNGG